MKLCRVEKFCFCINLQAGGVICSAYSILYFASSCVVIVSAYHGISADVINAQAVLDGVSLFCSLGGLFSSVPLLIGVFKESSSLLIPWITMMGADVLIGLIYLAYLACLPESWNLEKFPWLVAFDMLVWWFNVHCLLCIMSQYNKFKFANIGNSASVRKIVLAYKSSTTSDNIELDFV